jgi:PPE-repeat protein
MDFAFLAPEINSARMYGGPGSGPLLAAAGSWDALSAELDITAEGYRSALSSLTSLHWRGPAAQSMATTAASHAAWLARTAEQARQAALQARAAAAAFELAFAMTVPPAAVAVNRIRLSTLIATNFFGQNTAAIAATEAQYAEYWAQDAGAMYGYATSSAATTRLTPFSAPRQTSNPDGVIAQNAAVSQAVTSVTSNSLSQSASASETLPTSAPVPADFATLDGMLTVFGATDNLSTVESFAADIIRDSSSAAGTGVQIPATLPVALPAAPQLAGVSSNVGGGASAALGRAGAIGSMSVPANWTAPADDHVALLARAGAAPLAAIGEPAGAGCGIPGIPGMRPPYRATLVVPRYGFRVRVLPRLPAAW